MQTHAVQPLAGEIPADVLRTLTIPVDGDSTLAWGPQNDDLMRDLIERKLKEGFTFFVHRKRLGGVIPLGKARISTADEAMQARKVFLSDEEFAKVVSEGGVQMISRPERGLRHDDTFVSRDPAEIAAGQSIATRQLQGG